LNVTGKRWHDGVRSISIDGKNEEVIILKSKIVNLLLALALVLSFNLAAAVPAMAQTTVDISAIPGIAVPVTGGIPVTTFDPNNNEYTETVSWSPADNPFKASTPYTATITLTALGDYTFTGVAQDFFTVAGATATNSADSGVVTAVFPSTSATVINIPAIPGVTAPLTGGTPVTTITPTTEYTGNVSWSPADSPFKASTPYTATITLSPTTGYTLTGVTANFFTVAGATATNSANSGVVTAVFPSTSATVINIPAIPGVTAPLTGGTPVTAITPTSEYTGTVSWSPADNPFKASTPYTATITLSPTTGYTLTGVTANFFTVAGATATNSADSGVVTAVFPSTSATVINIPAIPGVTAPLTGGTPVTTITPTTEYTGNVSWSPADSPFKASTSYTATITLTALGGYTFTGVAQNFFTVAGATTTNSADSGVVTAVFPSTSAPVVPSISSISPISGPLAGGTRVTITGTNFITGATVTIDGVAASNIGVNSSTSITATTPAGTAGAKNVVVTNPDSQTGTLTGGFTYISGGSSGGGNSGGGGGGGGGVISMGKIYLSGFSSKTPLDINVNNGIVSSAANLTTQDGRVTLNIAAQTKLLSNGGNALSILTVENTTSPQAPSSGNALLLAYTLGPDGARFEPGLNLSMTYDPTKLPKDVAEKDVYISYFDGNLWQTLESTVDTQSKTVKANITHFSTYALMGKVTPVETPTPSSSPSPTPGASPTSTTPTSGTFPTSVTTTTPTGQSSPSQTTTPTSNPKPSPQFNFLILFVVIAAIVVILVEIVGVHRRRK
jgi:hypothetical protein